MCIRYLRLVNLNNPSSQLSKPFVKRLLGGGNNTTEQMANAGGSPASQRWVVPPRLIRLRLNCQKGTRKTRHSFP